jgi:phosphatidylserine decarboxylase
MAVGTTIDIFTENNRTVTVLESKFSGRIVIVAIGSMVTPT